MQIIPVISSILGLVAGVAIGYGFGLIQDVAQRRNQRREDHGKLKSAWSIMPGSMGRVALLLIVLALVQLICPLLFANGIQWWVSAGVAGGYGYTLYSHLRQKMSEQKKI